MKRYIYILSVLFAAAMLPTLILNDADGTDEQRSSIITRSIGAKDNPNGRASQEHLMLRDPASGMIPHDIRRRELSFLAHMSTAAQNGPGMFPKAAALSWEFRGPNNVAGRTRALAVDISNGDHLIAGGVSGGMWQSNDGGATWTKTTTPSQLHSVTCVAQDVRLGKTSTWYYGTGEKSGNSAGSIDEGVSGYLGDGIFKSTDNGASWQLLPATASNTPHEWDGDFDLVWNIATDAASTTSDIVYAAVFGGVVRSEDGGTSWTVVVGDLQDGEYADVGVSANGRVYAALSSDAGVNGGIHMSADGTNFQNITPQNFPMDFNRIVIATAPSNPEVAYFFVTNSYGEGNNSYGFWKYSDTGGWEDRSANLPDPTSEQDVQGLDTQGSYDQLIAVKPDNENTVFIGGTNLLRSTDAFATANNTQWIGGYSTLNDVSDYPNHHPDQHIMVFSPSNSNIAFCGNDGGISRTDDVMANTPDQDGHTVSWKRLVNGFVTTQFYGIAIDEKKAGDRNIIGGLQDRGNWASDAGNTAWDELTGGDGGFAAVGDGFFVISTQNGAIERVTIQPVERDDIKPDAASGQLFTTPYILDPVNTNVMYYPAGNTLWRNGNIPQATPNTGWTQLMNSPADEAITAITASKASPTHRVYYGTQNGSVYRLDDAHMGDPQAQQVIAGQGAYTNCIAVDPANGDNVMVVYSNYGIVSLLYSNDGGANWSAVSGNLEQNPDGSGSGPSVRWASILRVNNVPMYYVGTSVGMYSASTLNSNTQWTIEAPQKIGNVVVAMSVTRDNDNTIVVATHGAGVYSASAGGPTSAETPVAAEGFAVHSAYPNPFKERATIQYQVPGQSYVTVRVYNTSGEHVATIADAWKAAGTHSASFQPGGSLPAGMYFYRMSATNSQGQVLHNASGKMLRLR